MLAFVNQELFAELNSYTLLKFEPLAETPPKIKMLSLLLGAVACAYLAVGNEDVVWKTCASDATEVKMNARKPTKKSVHFETEVL
jgi:hypothetical protein